jgi:hypothetical protein
MKAARQGVPGIVKLRVRLVVKLVKIACLRCWCERMKVYDNGLGAVLVKSVPCCHFGQSFFTG